MIWCVCCFIAFISCLETEKPPLGAVLDGPRLPYDLQWNKPNVYDINGSNVGSWKQISFFSESLTAQQESVCWRAICVFYLSAATTWGALIFPLLQIPKQLRPESPHFPRWHPPLIFSESSPCKDNWMIIDIDFVLIHVAYRIMFIICLFSACKLGSNFQPINCGK